MSFGHKSNVANLMEKDFMLNKRNKWYPLCKLQSHLDGVRSLFFFSQDQILVSASEVRMPTSGHCMQPRLPSLKGTCIVSPPERFCR